jgi:hypothetical protein
MPSRRRQTCWRIRPPPTSTRSRPTRSQVADALKKSVGNNSLILATMRQQVMFQVIVPMMTGGNSNGSMLAFVLMFAMGGLV